jgi:hypothetical protein
MISAFVMRGSPQGCESAAPERLPLIIRPFYSGSCVAVTSGSKSLLATYVPWIAR